MLASLRSMARTRSVFLILTLNLVQRSEKHHTLRNPFNVLQFCRLSNKGRGIYSYLTILELRCIRLPKRPTLQLTQETLFFNCCKRREIFVSSREALVERSIGELLFKSTRQPYSKTHLMGDDGNNIMF